MGNKTDTKNNKKKSHLIIVTLLIYMFSTKNYFCAFLHREMPPSNKIGKMIAASIPAFKLSFAWLEINPTSVGPPEQPISPPSAKSANSAVPPFGSVAEALLKVPFRYLSVLSVDDPVILSGGDPVNQ